MSSEITFDRYNKKWIVFFLAFTIFYWLWFGLFIGADSSNLIFFSLLTALIFLNGTTRRIFVMFSPFITYLIGYSSLRKLIEVNIFPVHIEDLYKIEKSLFGIHYQGEYITLNEFFAQNLNTFSDIYAGLSYISWVPIPIVFTLFLFFKNHRKTAFDLWFAFLLANLLGFLGYIIYPAAPPWYYFEFGSELLTNAKGSAAGLAKFDEMIGYPLYNNMYGQSTNVFGAMPSMHAADPLILVFYSFKYKNKWLSTLFIISMVGIWYGAVYSSHHYLLDIVMGILCGILGIIVTELMFNRTFVLDWYKKTIQYLR